MALLAGTKQHIGLEAGGYGHVVIPLLKAPLRRCEPRKKRGYHFVRRNGRPCPT